MLGVYLTYLTGMIYPVLLLLILLGAVSFLLFRRRVRYAVFAALTCILCLVSCFTVFRIVSADIDDYSGEISEQVRIISVKRDLNGSSAVYFRTSDGVGAVMYSDNFDNACHPGAVIEVKGMLSCPESPTNPGDFNLSGYLRRRGIKYVFKAEDIRLISDLPLISGLNELIFNVRSYIFSHITSEMDEEERSLVAAICMGDTSYLSPEIRSLFSVSGCSHLIAVSGTHFSGFTAILAFVFNSRDKKNRDRVIMCILFIVFGFLTGFGDSVSRALIMSICVLFFRDKLSGMGLAISVMAVADPFGIMSSGFIMSIAAVTGMTLFVPRMRGIPDIISYPIAAHIGLMPFYGINGMNLSLQSFACQLAGGFIVSLICVLFIPVMVISLAVSGYAAVLIALPVRLLTVVLRGLLSLDLMSLSCADIGTEVFVAICVFLVVIVMPDCILKRIVFVPSFVIGALGAGVIVYNILFPGPLTAVFIDVGQGDSCLLLTPSYSILVDGGRYSEGEELLSVLDRYGIYSVDMAFVSHWDSDHCGGISYLENSGRIGQVIAPSECTFDSSDQHYVDNVHVSRTGDVYTIGDESMIRIISPDGENQGENDDSLVFYLESPYVSMLFTGDISCEKEDELMEMGRIVDCDILKVAHHGSRFSTGMGFLEQSSPEISVISCGINNSYGHPSGETLAKLQEFGSDVRRTDLEGAIVFEFNRTY